MKSYVIFGKRILKNFFLVAFIFIGMNAFSKNYNSQYTPDDSDKSGIYQFNLYPNPSSGKINLEIELSNYSPATLTVTNIIGQTMFQKKMENAQKINFVLDLSNRPKGIYLLNLQQGNQSISKKIIIE